MCMIDSLPVEEVFIFVVAVTTVSSGIPRDSSGVLIRLQMIWLLPGHPPDRTYLAELSWLGSVSAGLLRHAGAYMRIKSDLYPDLVSDSLPCVTCLSFPSLWLLLLPLACCRVAYNCADNFLERYDNYNPGKKILRLTSNAYSGPVLLRWRKTAPDCSYMNL